MSNCSSNSALLQPAPSAEGSEMIPNFSQCRPITKCSDIAEFLANPPEWTNRVFPLKKRSNHVVCNTFSNCHSMENEFNVTARLDSRTVPKTLVCHDYKGGYLSDSYIPFEGLENKTLDTDGYTFYNWSQIDYFVYFSHYFITIPPLAWTNIGHKNGVKVLGTIITESQEGMKICDEEIFSSTEKMREFVYQLVELQRTFGFDGWLLNIENEVKNHEILRDFVEYLTQTSREDNGESVIIWYDSVTRDGHLKWQDQLNIMNRCFFDSCDGIFLNYSWNEEKLENTAKMSGSRAFDVFVGIDVFGRNMFGGGQFNTYKAAEAARKHNLSIALFAPGWTHETMEQNSSGFVNFLNRDDALWASLWPYLYTHPLSDYFETDFHIGLDSSSYNLYMQKQQVSKVLLPEDLKAIPDHSKIEPLNTCDCLRRGFFESKNVCLIANYKLPQTNSQYVHKLFTCDIRLRKRTIVYYLSKKIDVLNDSGLDLVLLTNYCSGSVRKIKLLSQTKTLPVKNMSLLEVNRLKDEEIQYDFTLNGIAKRYMRLLSHPKYTGQIALNIFQFATTECDLLEIGGAVRGGLSQYLMEIGVLNAS